MATYRYGQHFLALVADFALVPRLRGRAGPLRALVDRDDRPDHPDERHLALRP